MLAGPSSDCLGNCWNHASGRGDVSLGGRRVVGSMRAHKCRQAGTDLGMPLSQDRAGD